MARQTRAQRRARRAQQGDGQPEAGAGSVATAPPAPPRRPPTRDGGDGAGPPGRRGRFVAESWGELKKVEWPGQSQVIQATVVVIIACVIVGIFLFFSDLAFERLVERILI